jgi:hypothetical protein
MTTQVLIFDTVKLGLSVLEDHDNGVNVYVYERSVRPLQLLLVTVTDGV